jgi:hypothetical protein
MSEKSFVIVTTTINIPYLLDDYAVDAKRFGRNLLGFIVIGDRKTPTGTSEYCAGLTRSSGIECRYVGPDEQDIYLSRWPGFRDYLPWNSIDRRNIGMIMAYQSGADIVVTIDDDNYLAQPDYLGCHAHLCRTQDVETVSNQFGWWNVCEMLNEARGIPFYHRGHPYSKRWAPDEAFQSMSTIRARAVVNAGLWLDDPDVDAVARLNAPIRATGLNPLYSSRVACDIGTWAPFNSQNTAMARDLIPAYFLFPCVGRYDDVWASYVMRHLTDAAGDVVTYGAPLVRQKRNPHSYFKDFDDERFGMEHTDLFIEALRCCKVGSGSYRDEFAAVARQFPDRIRAACERVGKDPVLFVEVAQGLTLWADLFAEM